MAWWGGCLGLGWYDEVGVREVGRWWKTGQCVNGVEGKACVMSCALQVASDCGRWR